MTSLEIRLIGEGSRGSGTGNGGDSAGLHIGIQHRSEVIDVVPGNAPRAAFALSVDLVSTDNGGRDVRGPYVHGSRGDRFLYLSWGEVDEDGTFGMVKRMKIKLGSIEPDLIERALESGATLQGTLPLVDEAGRPLSGTIRPDLVAWTLVSGDDRA